MRAEAGAFISATTPRRHQLLLPPSINRTRTESLLSPRKLHGTRYTTTTMAYHGRRGPNVSEYIANLNAIPTAQDLQNSNADNFNLDDDLAMFTNTQFFDFDLGQDADLPPPFDGRPETADMKPLDFIPGTPSRLSSLDLTSRLHCLLLPCLTTLSSFSFLGNIIDLFCSLESSTRAFAGSIIAPYSPTTPPRLRDATLLSRPSTSQPLGVEEVVSLRC